MADSRPGAPPAANKFGTFAGVFTPCTLTILGVIMFLRFGQVMAYSGLFWGLAIVLASKLITTLTALSLSAIATNTRVQGGGAYFLISRSLGVEFGGAIGIVFFLAQAVSVAMYVIGFTEAFVASFPGLGLPPRVVATVVNIATFACVYIGAGWTIKVQYGILAALGLSLLSFFAGAAGHASLDHLASNTGAGFGEKQSLFTMFALFFPAATGIMAGANMSGDLKDPARAIPRGTLLAIAATGAVYLGMAAMLCLAAPRETLLADNLVVRSVSWSPALITVGIFSATLSSALGSMMGAPRILQALARDDVFERLGYFGHGSGAAQEPRRATILTFAIAQAGVLLGDLDLIAPIITMFFMITYGYLNLASFTEAITKNPSYRPTFRWSHWSTSLLGALGCLGAMFLIDALWATLSVAAMFALHRYIERQEILATWGEVQSGTAFERARKNLLRLEDEKYHPKNWRPSILALSGGAWNRVHLAVYGSWLTGGRGILTLAQVIPGDIDAHFRRRAKQESVLREFIRAEGLRAFPAVLVAPGLVPGVEALAQCYGIGALRPNVLLLGWSADPERQEEFGGLLRTLSGLEKSVVVIRGGEEEGETRAPGEGPVDVWWRGKANGQLLLLLAHLLTQNEVWRGRTIRLLRVIASEAGREEATHHLEDLIRGARIHAVAIVLVSDDPVAAIGGQSRDSAAVFLGFQPPKEGEERDFVRAMGTITEGFRTAVLAWSAGDMKLEA